MGLQSPYPQFESGRRLHRLQATGQNPGRFCVISARMGTIGSWVSLPRVSLPHNFDGLELLSLVNVLVSLILLGLVPVLIQWVARAIGYRRASGRSFKKLGRLGRVPEDVRPVADEIILERARRRGAKRRHDPAYAQMRTQPKPKFSEEQLHALKAARSSVRNEYLEHVRPGFYHYVIIFMVASVAGLVLEMVFMFITAGRTELRVGLVWGPFSPLYGFGACLLTMVLWNFRTAPTIHVFLVSALLGGGLEQTTGMLMENLFHAQSWTYLGLPDAITQWIAWRFLFGWGFIGLVWCRLIMPEVIYRIGEPGGRMQVALVAVLTTFLIVDMLATVYCFYRKSQRDLGIPPANVVDRYVDERFSDEFIERRFQNLVVGEQLEPNK